MAAKSRLGGRKELTAEKLGKIPQQSGIYLFRDKQGDPLKVGMAGARRLQERVKENLSKGEVPGAKTVQVRPASGTKEAERLEKEYIKRYKPKLN